MTDFKDFKFTGPKLDDFDFPRLGHLIGVGEDVMHAVLDTEAGRSSVDKNGRMKALYEPHVAWRNSSGTTRTRLAKAGLAYPDWKRNYPADSYPRIKKAIAIDETVALLASSWGFPQILGENFALAGYQTVQDMVLDFLQDEDNQLEGMINFIKNANLDDELRALQAKIDRGERITPDDCRAFVRGYNGKQYAKNDYHTIFATNLNKWVKIKDTPWVPGLVLKPADGGKTDSVVHHVSSYKDGQFHPEVKSVQTKLDELGYPEVGTLDGIWGTKTAAAILAFQNDNDLPTDATITPGLLASLMVAQPRHIAPARKEATLDTLRKEGAEDVEVADESQLAGTVVTGAGAVVGGGKLLDEVQGYSGVLKTVSEAIQPVQSFITDNVWVLLLGAGGFVVWKSGVLKRIRLDKHRTGNDVSV